MLATDVPLRFRQYSIYWWLDANELSAIEFVRDFVADTQYGIQLLKRDDDNDVFAVDFFLILVGLLMPFDLVEHFRITGVLRTDDCHWSTSFKHLTLRSNRLVRLKFSQR